MTVKKCMIQELVIGTWALAGDYWGEQNHSDSIKTIHSAIRNELTTFDTSPDYGKGKSEQLLGQQLQKFDTQTIISTKSFIKPIKSLEKGIYNSLKRLNREQIDFFFIHWPSTKDDCRPTMELLEKFRSQGIIKYIGVSNFNKEELNMAEQAGKIDIVQNAFNFFWKRNMEYLKYCHSKNIVTQIYSPLAQGLLTGKFTKENPYPKNDLRWKMTLFNDKNIEIVYSYITKLQNLLDKENLTMYDAIIKWTLSQNYIDSIAIGCRTRKQIEALKNSSKLSISKKIITQIEEISTEVNNLINQENNIFNHSY